MITVEDLEWWDELAPKLAWKRAVTMPDAPHSYVVRDQMLDGPDFERAVKVIRTFGEPGKFYNRTNIYLTINGTKWWTMGAPLEETIIINQAASSKVYGEQDAPHTATGRFTVYDSLATEYDDRYTSPECHAENESVRRIITTHFGPYAPSTLDVGCGTGLLLDMGVTSPALFTGIDPSQGMLNELVRKHPKVSHLHPETMEEALVHLMPRQFELVTVLFGTASYISPEALLTLPIIARDLVVLMHYEDGYLPDYYEGRPKPPHLETSRQAAANLLKRFGGEMTKIGRFDVTVLPLLPRRER